MIATRIILFNIFIFGFINGMVLNKTNGANLNIPKENIKLHISCSGAELSKVCITIKNDKIMRQISYLKGEIFLANVYYASGNIAKVITFNNNQLTSLSVYFDKNISGNTIADTYIFFFKNGKFTNMHKSMLSNFVSLSKNCIENSQDRHKCDELNFFTKSNEPDLPHPALSLPIENKGLGVLEMNGIKIP